MYVCCLCQSIEINNNKHVYRQSQVRMPNGCGVEWAECSLIIGTGCRVQFLAWSSIAQSVCQRAFSLLAIWCLRHQNQHVLLLKAYDFMYKINMSVVECLYVVVRLRGGETESEGRLEIFHDNEWGTICHDRWGNWDATVACKSLGFSSGKYQTWD